MKRRFVTWLWLLTATAGCVFVFSRALDVLCPEWYCFAFPQPRVVFSPADAVPMAYWFWTGILPVVIVLSGLLLIERMKR
ncbi:MAG: hypothetical protein RBS80_08470 [Thermoguttaceae bacterium]|jgi:hypothetical protein|nr:hypothetical protein [Thermoguttaceae bacterium]